jgi:hypothetical protein
MAKGLREGILVEISVVNLLGGSPRPSSRNSRRMSTMWYWSVKTSTHKFFTMQGLLCKITWAGVLDIGRAIREWVHDKIFHGMFADPTTRLKYAQEERAQSTIVRPGRCGVARPSSAWDRLLELRTVRWCPSWRQTS